MKLVELLARELDVWPEGVVAYFQWGNGEIFATSKSVPTEYDYGMWIVSGSHIEMAYDAPLYDTAHELATDHAAAIITRADWQAERERIAGGWIAWGGGECPVEEGAMIDTLHRDGQERLHTSCGQYGTRTHQMFWSHSGDSAEVIAYRLHKPEQASAEAIDAGIAAADAGQVKPIEEVKAMYEYNPIHTRNRILEIDRTTEALEEERVQLVQRLADDGFVLARVDGKVAPDQPVEDMSDWRNWREGDMLVVEDNVPDTHEFKVGELVKFMHHDENHDEPAPHCESNYDDWWVLAANLKFHSRPTA